MATNILDLFNHVQKQGEMGRERGRESTLASLYQKAYTAPQSERQGYIGQMAGVDPRAAMSADKAFSDSDDDGMSRLAQKAAMFVGMAEGGNEAVVAGMYPQIAAEARRLGLGDIPEQYDPSFLPGLKQFAQHANRGSASGIQSTYVDAQGNRVGIMRDGRTQVLGQNAPANQIIDTGNGFFGVNKGNLQAAPVMIGGQQQAPQQQQPGTRQISDFQAVDESTGQPITDPAELAAIQASIPQLGGGGGQQLRSVPKIGDQGDKASNWQIVQGQDGTFHRVNKLTGEEASVGVQGANALRANDQHQKRADAIAGTEGAIRSTDQTIESLNLLLNHPGRGSGTGMSAILPAVPGSSRKDFDAQLATFKAQTFVPMVSQLKGMGALSDAEGKKLTEAVGAIDAQMSEPEFVASLNRIKASLSRAQAAAYRKITDMKNNQVQASAARPKEATAGVLVWNPATGDFD